MLLSLVFGGIFLGLLGALTSYVLLENRLQDQKDAQGRAFAIAEAGLEYYRWFLAHYPGNVTNGVSGGPTTFTLPYYDPEGEQLGNYTLTLNQNSACGAVSSVDIESEGATLDMPQVTQTVSARYAQPSVGRYSYVLNDSVWAGADRIILGPYHSNGGIRMDGTANSSVSSSVSTWNCTSSYGCSPTQSAAPGVVGTGPNQSLWTYPVPQVDFAAIAADFASLKSTAQAQGLYYPRYSNTNNPNSSAYWHGYHLTFNANDTVTVRRVTSTTELEVEPVNPAETLDTDRALIANETMYETRTIPASCGLIYVEDHVWIDGTIPSEVTVVAANTASGLSPNAYLRNNIVYENTDGSSGLTLIAENNVLIAPNAPAAMTLNGIFIAQNGAFGRNLYYNNSRTACHSTYEPKTSLTILGTTVSNKRTGTKWTGVSCSGGYAGFGTRIDSYDEQMAIDPPPFTPIVSTDYEIMDWRER
ncbi:MAG: hypothetical protein KBC38_03590 [Candidatus Pacebacteria bacterium]|nr:hypothetical protein [Candidatus Paceibacterota bacterium]MBP9840139.1 hypothetical protein [Candidatus Paceibacterota bacterium]